VAEEAEPTHKELLGAALKEWRKGTGDTQAEAGDKLGVSGGAYGGWERGKTWPQTAQRETLREFFKANTDVLRVLDQYEASLRIRKGRRRPHTGAVWTIRAKKNNGDPVELGDLAGHGYLIDRLKAVLPNLREMQAVDAEGSMEAVAEVVRMVKTGKSNEVGCVLELHEFGVSSVIAFDDGPRPRYPRNPETVEAMVIIRAGKKQTTGLLAVHFAHRRGAKVTVGNEIETVIRGAGLTPEIKAAGTEQAVRKALLDNRVKEYRFVAHENPSDRFADDRVKQATIGRVETSVYPERGEFLSGQWLREFLDGGKKKAEFNRLVTFDGKPYDKASVVVTLGNGRERTVNVTEADEQVGHAITYDLADEEDQPLPPEVDDQQLIDALHELLDDHAR